MNMFLFVVVVLTNSFGITSSTWLSINRLFSKVKLSDILLNVPCLLVIRRQLFLCLHVASLTGAQLA